MRDLMLCPWKTDEGLNVRLIHCVLVKLGCKLNFLVPCILTRAWNHLSFFFFFFFCMKSKMRARLFCLIFLWLSASYNLTCHLFMCFFLFCDCIVKVRFKFGSKMRLSVRNHVSSLYFTHQSCKKLVTINHILLFTISPKGEHAFVFGGEMFF